MGKKMVLTQIQQQFSWSWVLHGGYDDSYDDIKYLRKWDMTPSKNRVPLYPLNPRYERVDSRYRCSW